MHSAVQENVLGNALLMSLLAKEVLKFQWCNQIYLLKRNKLKAARNVTLILE